MGISPLWNVFFIAAFSQGIFISIILFIQYFRFRFKSQLYLGLFILAFSFILITNTIYWNQMYGDYPHFMHLPLIVRYTLAPLFFLFVISYLNKRVSKLQLLHFIPAAIIFLAYAQVIFISSSDKIDLVLRKYPLEQAWRPVFGEIAFMLMSLHLIVYSLYIIRIIRNKLKSGTKAVSKNFLKQIKWLKFLNMLFLMYSLLMLLYFVLIAINVGGVDKDYYISLVMCVAIYSISYVGLFNPELLKGEEIIEKIVHPKYSRTRLKNETLDDTLRHLEITVLEEQLYLDPDISLEQVASALGIPKHYISQALSLRKGRTFKELINGYRIEHAQKLLNNISSEDNIKTVMHSSGFNNRVSFNNNFKKMVGMTASEYVKSGKIDQY